MILFIGFAFLMGSMIVLSIIPIYIADQSVPRTSFIQTSMIYSINYQIKRFFYYY